ncbi:MAG: hypothetical protein A2X86_18300 [Bdellovibrionales bacterium GWA2_49_15]|nr:MAG: hypothetical protein A2X86_18300 [Bdellovibrionales bacterium GWA2_49_15]HAZ11676.1 hypothetical protein [Bdellovibrionales bacterium]
MIILKYILCIQLVFGFSVGCWSASVPSFENIQNCKCDSKFQSHFFKDLKNKSEIQISKGHCACGGKKQDVTAVCPTKKKVLRKFMACAQDTTISAELSVTESVEGASDEIQSR